MAKTCLLFNAAAGSARAAEDTIREFVQRSGVELRPTRRPGDVEPLMRGILDDGFARVIVAGGDGTISQAVLALAPDFGRIEVAIAPLGTGNDLARALSIDAANLEAALKNALESSARPMDVIQVDDDHGRAHFINAASGGIAGKVAAEVDAEDKQMLGPMAYWMTAVSELADPQPYQVELEFDDGRREQLDVYGLYLANGRYVGGGFTVAPDALLDDGLLDLTAIPALPMLELMGVGLRIALGGQTDDPRLPRFRSSRVHLRSEPDMHFSVDGEPARAIEAQLEVLPGVLRIVPGPNPEALRVE